MSMKKCVAVFVLAATTFAVPVILGHTFKGTTPAHLADGVSPPPPPIPYQPLNS